MSANTVKAKVPATRDARKVAKAAKAVRQITLPVSWVGIDRAAMPPGPANNATGWMAGLIDNSNLRFTGAYLTGPAAPVADYTSSTRSPNRHWVENVGGLRDQGWGIAFWYVGYSIGGGHPAPAGLSAIAAARGTLHAKHAKGIVQAMNPELAGAVIFLDNEDSKNTVGKLLDPIRDYYKAFFAELETPGDGPALRCGLYAHSEVAAEFVKDRPDLLVWEVRLDNATLEPKRDKSGAVVKDPTTQRTVYTPNTKQAPFETTSNPSPMFIDPAAPAVSSPQHVQSDRNINSFAIKNSATDEWVAWPIGRQFRYYIGDMPTAAWHTAHNNTAPLLSAVNSFDYDTCLVRDPSYPVAEPRIAASADEIVVAGVFVARSAGGASAATMKIEGLESTGRVAVIPALNCVVEPDAPIAVAAHPGADTHFMTVHSTGELATFTRSSAGTWLTIDPITFTSAPRLRRLRAVALVAYDTNDLRVFYAGEDHQLYTSRSQSSGAPGTWDDPTVTGSLLVLHPFSSLAAASRAGLSVDVFALDAQGLLNACSWSAAEGTWQQLTLETSAPSPVPSLLKAGALAATSPDPEKLFVFGIRTDLRLGCWEWTGPAGVWLAPTALGGTTARLSPHSRLAAHSYAGVVEVVALSHDGTLRLYTVKLTGEATWAAQTPIPFDNPDDEPPEGYVVPPASSPSEEAYGWSINPYGDLAIVRETNGTVVYAAGVAPGKSGLLSLNLSIGGSTWQLLR